MGWMTYEQALELPDRDNREGVVIYRGQKNAAEEACLTDLVKIKQARYLEIHKLVTGLTPKSIWRMMMDDNDLSDILLDTHDEFHDWVSDVWNSIMNEVHEMYLGCVDAFNVTTEALPDDYTQKDFAMKVREVPSPYREGAFIIQNSDDYGSRLYKFCLSHCKPEVE